jgi:hypothetical protein
MNSSETKLKNFFRALVMKPVRPRFHRDPYGDWKKILSAFFIFMVIIVMATTYVFYKLTRGELFVQSSTASSTAQILDKNQLKKINSFYDAREERLKQLESSTDISIDPL